MENKTSDRGSKQHKEVSPHDETKDAETSQGDSESGSKLQIPKLKIPELVKSPKYRKPMRNYIPRTKRMLKTLAEKAAKQPKKQSLVEFLLNNPSRTDDVEIDLTRDKSVYVDRVDFNGDDFV
jgi:hypothetical protein